MIPSLVVWIMGMAAGAIAFAFLSAPRRHAEDDGPLTLADVRGRLPVELGRASDPRTTETALALYPAPNNRCPSCGALFEPILAEAECYDCRHPSSKPASWPPPPAYRQPPREWAASVAEDAEAN